MASENEKSYIMKFAAKLDSSLKKSFSQINTDLDKLKNAEKSLGGFKKSSEQTKEYAKKLAEVSEKAKLVNDQVKNFGTVTSKNQKKFDALIQKQTTLNAKQEVFKSRLLESAQATKDQVLQLHKLGLTTKAYSTQLGEIEKKMLRLKGEKMGMGVASKHVSGLKNLAKGVLTKVAQATKTVAIGGMIAGGAFAFQAGRSYVDFEKQMKKVQAISGATREEYKSLEGAAINLGATTSFTAQEAAAGMEKFALAGFKTKEIMEVMPAVLSLTAASGEDLAMVADIISDNLVPFKMTAKDTAKFADILANTMSRTNVNVGMLGESLKYVAGDASSLGLSLSETTASLGLMGDQAIKSGMAGRDLKAAFSSLADSKIQKNLRAVGINVKNIKTGDFVGLPNLIEQIQKKTSKMTGIQKVGFLKANFGEQGALAIDKLLGAQKEFNGVILTGADALRALADENERSQGKAKQMEATMLEGAQGALTLLSSAWNTIKIISGKLMFSENVVVGIRKITDGLGELANVLSGNFNDNPLNKFFSESIAIAKVFKKNFITAIEPIAVEIKKLMPSKEGFLEIVARYLKMITDNIKALAPALSIVVKLFGYLVRLIDFIGPDNILMILAIGLAIGKVLIPLLEFIRFVRTAGAVLGYLKGVIAALGGPYTILIAAIIFLCYWLEKNGGLVNNLKAIWMAFWELLIALAKYISGAFLLPFALVQGAFNGIIAVFTSWDSDLTFGENLLNGVNVFIETFKSFIQPLWDWMFSGFAGVWEKIKQIPFVAKLMGNVSIAPEVVKNAEVAGQPTVEDSRQMPINSEVAKNAEIAGQPIVNAQQYTFISPEVIKNIEVAGQPMVEGSHQMPIAPEVIRNVEIAGQPTVDGSHYDGLNHVPYDGYIAELHKGERVLTAEENSDYSGGMLERAKGTTNTTANSTSNYNSGITISIAPTYIISGNNSQELKNEISNSENDMAEMIKKILKEMGINNMRVAY